MISCVSVSAAVVVSGYHTIRICSTNVHTHVFVHACDAMRCMRARALMSHYSRHPKFIRSGQLCAPAWVRTFLAYYAPHHSVAVLSVQHSLCGAMQNASRSHAHSAHLLWCNKDGTEHSCVREKEREKTVDTDCRRTPERTHFAGGSTFCNNAFGRCTANHKAQNAALPVPKIYARLPRQFWFGAGVRFDRMVGEKSQLIIG